MRPVHLFRYCPRCSAKSAPVVADNLYRCGGCGWTYFFNPAASVAVFVTDGEGRVLLIRRARDPGKGKLAPPGGFIDFGERAEDAVHREIREEVGLQLTDVRFISSHPNDYPYDGITYPVLDFFFSARAIQPDHAKPLDEVLSVDWHPCREIDPSDLAFPSMQQAFRIWHPG